MVGGRSWGRQQMFMVKDKVDLGGEMVIVNHSEDEMIPVQMMEWGQVKQEEMMEDDKVGESGTIWMKKTQVKEKLGMENEGEGGC